MSQTNWEADKMLDVYIHDYLTKRKLHATAKAFQAEGKVSSDPVAIDAPGGFLFEWWSVFWDIFIARTNEKHSDVAASYIETQHIKAREQQQQQQQPLQSQHQHHQQQQQQQQLQQMLLQRQVQQQQQQQQQQPQQQRRDGPHLLNGSANGLISSDSLSRQSPGTANVMATKMYEERLKLPLRESMEDAATKRFNDNSAPLLDTNHPSMLKSAATSGQTPGQVMHGTSGALPCSLPQVQPRGQQIPGSVQDIKTEVNPVMNSRAAGPDSLVGVPGSNQGANNLTLRGWPLTGIDQLRSGILQQKPFLQSPQPFHQLQVLTPQQQLLLQAQQRLNPSAGDAETRRLRMYLSNQNMILGKDNQQNPVGDGIPSVGSPMQSASPVMPRGETDMLIKKIAQLHQQQQQQGGIQQQTLQQHGILNQQSQSSNQSILQQDKMATGSVTMIGSGSSSFRGNDQASKSQNGRKRKQPVSSSDPANSSGTANTAGPSPSSAPSTPSTHTPGDVISMPPIPHSGTSSKPLMMFSSDGPGTLPSPSNQLWDDKGELLVEDPSLEDNVDSFLSHDENDARDAVGRSDTSKGFSFNEVVAVHASVSKVVCCHFSSDGKLLATGGHDKKAVLWFTENLKPKTTLEEHTSIITDIRFSPSMSRLATSSFDKTVRVWDADNPSYSLRTFTGHSSSVMSLDFHPNREDLICSCDGMGQIRYWSINNGSCNGVSEGATTQIRFQPRIGKYLAAASDKVVNIIDVETQTARQTLQTHTSTVHSVCWNATGDCLASVSEDSVKVWSFGSGGEGECIHELSNGNKFHSCVFHPSYPSLLVIGCYQSLELWNMVENKTMTLSAHEGLIASLAVSNVTGYVASASHDKFVKLWK